MAAEQGSEDGVVIGNQQLHRAAARGVDISMNQKRLPGNTRRR